MCQSRYHSSRRFGGWNSQEAIIKAAEYAQQIREDCLATRKSIAFETVFSIHDKLQLLAAS